MGEMDRKSSYINYIIENTTFFEDGLDYYEKQSCSLPTKFKECAKKIRDFKVYEDDVFVLSFPKCGTTWAQEMIWLLGNNLDYNAAEENLYVRFPLLESGYVSSRRNPLISSTGIQEHSVAYAEKMRRPRYIKSHLHVDFLPSQLLETKPKIIVVVREPKDAAVSFYHHHCIFNGYSGTLEKFLEAFMEGCVLYGNYWIYTASLWQLWNQPNVLFITYEEMKKDLPSAVARTAKFLDKTFTAEQITTLIDHLDFTKMKTNQYANIKDVVELFRSVNRRGDPYVEFIRRGEVGDYKNLMSEEMVKSFDAWSGDMKSKLGLTGDKDFPY